MGLTATREVGDEWIPASSADHDAWRFYGFRVAINKKIGLLVPVSLPAHWYTEKRVVGSMTVVTYLNFRQIPKIRVYVSPLPYGCGDYVSDDVVDGMKTIFHHYNRDLQEAHQRCDGWQAMWRNINSTLVTHEKKRWLLYQFIDKTMEFRLVTGCESKEDIVIYKLIGYSDCEDDITHVQNVLHLVYPRLVDTIITRDITIHPLTRLEAMALDPTMWKERQKETGNKEMYLFREK